MLPFILIGREGKTEKWRLIQDCRSCKQEREGEKEIERKRERKV